MDKIWMGAPVKIYSKLLMKYLMTFFAHHPFLKQLTDEIPDLFLLITHFLSNLQNFQKIA